jgi:hypothetical protein
MDLRCPHKLHGVVIGDASGVVEIQCRSRWCGSQSGVVVLHRFDLSTGDLMETRQYRSASRKE